MKEEIKVHNENLESVIEQVSETVLELHIRDDAQAKMKFRKLAIVVCDAEDEVWGVTFEFQMQISKLNLKPQPTTPPEVRERGVIALKESMGKIVFIV